MSWEGMQDFSKHDVISGLIEKEIKNPLSDNFDTIADDRSTESRLTTSTNVANSSRFAKPITKAELEKEVTVSVPSNTLKRNRWVINLFEKWFHERPCVEADKKYFPSSSTKTEHLSEGQVKYLIPKFIFDVRKTDG